MPYILWYVNEELSDKAFYCRMMLPAGVCNGSKIVRGHTSITIEQIIYEQKIKWTVLQINIDQFNAAQAQTVFNEFGFEEANDLEEYLNRKAKEDAEAALDIS